nr:hypothetical protein Iba_chr02aCG9820 [Ipomoea batatas]
MRWEVDIHVSCGEVLKCWGASSGGIKLQQWQSPAVEPHDNSSEAERRGDSASSPSPSGREQSSSNGGVTLHRRRRVGAVADGDLPCFNEVRPSLLPGVPFSVECERKAADYFNGASTDVGERQAAASSCSNGSLRRWSPTTTAAKQNGAATVHPPLLRAGANRAAATAGLHSIGGDELEQ